MTLVFLAGVVGSLFLLNFLRSYRSNRHIYNTVLVDVESPPTPPPLARQFNYQDQQGYFTTTNNITDSKMCSFDYDGPLKNSTLNCFIEYFDFASPVQFSSYSNMSHTVRGITWTEGPAPVPIFILFRDRVSIVIEVIRSFHRYIRTPFEIVIFNDRSSFPVATNFLMRLEASGLHIHHSTIEWENFDQLYSMLAKFIEDYMASSQSEFYVLTDPDCALDSAPWNILDVYQRALVELKVTAIGASIRWDDWSDLVWNTGYERSYTKLTPQIVGIRGKTYYYIDAPVDTTFAMYRKGKRISRLTYARMLPPLGVRHLDFYLEKNIPPDYVYYHNHSRKSGVNHMSHILRLRPKMEKYNKSDC